MSDDEMAIRDLVKRWMDASKAGDLATVRSLMSDDVVFMTVGSEPFGKEAFDGKSPAGVKVDGSYEIQEIQIVGEWAWMRNKLRVEITPAGGEQIVKAGYVLTVLKKRNGQWVLARDANLLVTVNDD